MANENLYPVSWEKRLKSGVRYTGLKEELYNLSPSAPSVIWESEEIRIVSINETTGIIDTGDAGTTYVKARAIDSGEIIGICTITVEGPIYIENLSFKSNNYTLYKSSSYDFWSELNILPNNAEVRDLIWSSTDESIAIVDSYSGCVTAISEGSAKIHVVSAAGVSLPAECDLVVKLTNKDPVSEEYKNIVPGSKVVDPVDVATGTHTIQNNLMSLFGGQNLKVVAQYTSANLICGELGCGWYHNYEKFLVIGDGEILAYSNPREYLTYAQSNIEANVYNCIDSHKNGYVLTIDATAEYPYVINCNYKHFEYYNANGKLAKVADHSGFETQISYDGTITTITDCLSGKRIYMEKNSEGRVIRVYDDAQRETVLAYTDEFLTTITDVNGNTLNYTYYEDSKLIKNGTDSRNICYFTNIYDDFGRIKEQKDALNNVTRFSYSGRERVVTSRNGKETKYTLNDNGGIETIKDANGFSTFYFYDDYFNVVAEVDAKNKEILTEYNNFNKPTKITDKNKKETCFSYDDKGNVISITYPTVNGVCPTESFTYNARNQITSHTDLRGTTTVYTYDENSGMPTSKKIGSRRAVEYCYQNGLLVCQTDARGYMTRYEYNTLGQLIKKIDANNKETTYEYDFVGNLLKTIDHNGNSIIIEYDSNYQKISETDANGNKTEYSYNGNMKNTVIRYPDGNTIEYEYDAEDRLVEITDQAKNVTTLEYDDIGRQVSKKFADGAEVTYEYDAVGNVITETNPKGGVMTKTYDAMGNVLTMTESGHTTTYEYDPMSRVTKMTNAVNGITVYEYSSAGDLLSESDPMGNRRRYTYDAYGNRLTMTDPNGNETGYTYDDNNNLLTVTDPLQHDMTYTYNNLNQCISVKDALHNVIQYGYDALGRRTSIIDAKGNIFNTEYDANGNVTKTTDAKGKIVSQTTYDALNRPLTVTDAMGKATTYTYNAIGKVKSVTDAFNNQSEYSYDKLGRNTAVVDANDNTSSITYDTLGNVTRLAGPLGAATTYSYDNMGKLTSESTVSDGTVSYTYNALNLKAQITNARGQARSFTYDKAGRITSCVSPERTTCYTYDANGNVTLVSDEHSVVSRTFDALNRVTSYTDTYGNTIGYEYDEVGNLKKLIYPDNTEVIYSYDANRNLVQVTDWCGRVTTYSYDVNNKVIGATKPDGSITTILYDDMRRIVSNVERKSNMEIISGFEYEYDDLSRIIVETLLSNSIKICYTYYYLSRVTSKTVKNLSDDTVISTETFSYDAAGNVIGASSNAAFVYDLNNRLTSFNGEDVTYDLDGNMLSNGSLTCTYDSTNKLLTAGVHTYTYDVENVRIRNVCEDADTIYVYDTNCKLSRLLAKMTNGFVTKYVYGRGLIGEEKDICPCSFKTYHFDSRGSTVAITDEGGNVTDTFTYDTYGKLVNRTGNSFVIFGYNGRDGVVTDKNGLIYMRARYYSPDMKRFVNADIVAGTISNAITLNRFAYANGNPVSFVDPFGLSPERESSLDEWGFFFDYAPAAIEDVEWIIGKIYDYQYDCEYDKIFSAKKPKRFHEGSWMLKNDRKVAALDEKFGAPSFWEKALSKTGKIISGIGYIVNGLIIISETKSGIDENIDAGNSVPRTISDAIIDMEWGIGVTVASAAIGTLLSGVPGIGPIIGTYLGGKFGETINYLFEADFFNGKSALDLKKEFAGEVADFLVDNAPDIAILSSSMPSVGGGAGGGGVGMSALTYTALGMKEYRNVFVS